MATKQVRVCDFCDGVGAVTWVVLNNGRPRRADLCPNCSKFLNETWIDMPVPAARRSTRRLEKVTMAEVEKARKATRALKRP